MTYEYAALVNDLEGNVIYNSTGATGADSTEVGANAGADGWEAFAVAAINTSGSTTAISTAFKRPTA